MSVNELLSPGLGHNQPPPDSLADLLPEETAILAARAVELAASACERATVASDEEAERAVLLCAMLREHYKATDDARKARKEPFLSAGRIVDAHFTTILRPLDLAHHELLARVDAWRRHKEAAAAVERRRLEDEARREREAAAAEARNRGVEAEMRRRAAEDRAAQLDAQAAAQEPVVIASGYGPKASRRTTYTVAIDNLRTALAHCLRIDRHRIEEAVLDICRAQVRAGVRELPGARIIEDSSTVVRR